LGRSRSSSPQFQRDAVPSRRNIGTYGEVNLEEARRIAGECRSLVAKGIDPSVVEAEAKAAAAREAALRVKHSFTAVPKAFSKTRCERSAVAKKTERDFRANVFEAWAGRAVSEITALDELEIIHAKNRHAPAMARALLTMLHRFYDWVIDQQIYGRHGAEITRRPNGCRIGVDTAARDVRPKL
jgi:Arm DNA-binding domain